MVKAECLHAMRRVLIGVTGLFWFGLWLYVATTYWEPLPLNHETGFQTQERAVSAVCSSNNALFRAGQE